MKRIGNKGEGKFAPISWEEAIETIAARLQAITARGGDAAQAILPYSYAGTMGLVQGESMAMRFFNKLGASLLERTICATAGGEGYKYTIGARIGTDVEQTEHAQADPDLGRQPDRFQPAFLDARTTGQAQRRQADRDRSVPLADRGEMPSAYRAAARHRCRAGARPDACADCREFDRPGLHRSLHRRLRRSSSERVAEWPPQRVAETCGISVEEVRATGARLRRHRAARRSDADPAQLRRPAHPRRRHGGAQCGLPAGAGGRLAACRRRCPAVQFGCIPERSRSAGTARFAGRAQSAQHQYGNHRRRFAARRQPRIRPQNRSADRV